jgi:D-alanine-D-alanine ligase-like ATP-grasp enzyme/glycosyltransferase involved in cell wall biosynthesis
MEDNKKKVIVIMPAYNAGKTLEATVRALPAQYDELLLCDDGSVDDTYRQSEKLGITTVRHGKNRGYGANQKTLYALALEKGADIVVMVHPDNQYNTEHVPDMVELIRKQSADLVLGSRMNTALEYNMPWWKYGGNRFLTTLQNSVFGTHFSEFHSGLRAYDARLLTRMPLHTFSDDFVFDAEVIAWCVANGYRIREVPTECYYNTSVSSVNFQRSVVYGFATLYTLFRYMYGLYGQEMEKRLPVTDLCLDCDPLRTSRGHVNERITQSIDMALGALFFGVTHRRWFMRCTNSVTPFLITMLMGIGIFRESDITSEYEQCIYNRTLVVLQEARKRGMDMRAITCFGLCTKFFTLNSNGLRVIFDELPTVSLRGDDCDFSDKHVFKKTLEEHGFPVPRGVLCRTLRDASAVARRLGYPLVVKPTRGSLSKHTTCGIISDADLHVAVKRVKVIAREFLVEQHVEGDVYRVTVVGGSVAGCCLREVPNVTGDGVRSVRELVKEKNADPRRGPVSQKNSTLHHLSITNVTDDILRAQGMTLDSVPKRGEKVTLHSKVILGAGADIHDRTDDMHPDNKRLFEDVAKIWCAPLVGFDALFFDISLSWHEQKCAIIEANSKPYIDMHHVPVSGRPRNVASLLIDYIITSH